MLSDDVVDSLNVGLPGFGVSCVVVAERTIRTRGHPARETTASTFRIDVGTGTIEDIQTELFASLEKTADIVGTTTPSRGA